MFTITSKNNKKDSNYISIVQAIHALKNIEHDNVAIEEYAGEVLINAYSYDEALNIAQHQMLIITPTIAEVNASIVSTEVIAHLYGESKIESPLKVFNYLNREFLIDVTTGKVSAYADYQNCNQELLKLMKIAASKDASFLKINNIQ